MGQSGRKGSDRNSDRARQKNKREREIYRKAGSNCTGSPEIPDRGGERHQEPPGLPSGDGGRGGGSVSKQADRRYPS